MSVHDTSPSTRGRNKRYYLLWLIAIAAVCLAAYISVGRLSGDRASLPEQSGPQVVAEFVANTDAVVPGDEFLIGVHFAISPGWHIYHKDPGDAGLPTSVSLTLPPGFTAGSVLYPRPVQFKQPGDIAGNGYKEEVMLLVPVVPPPDLKPGQSVSLQARAQWLACREICVLGEQNVEQTLPVASKANTFRKELFEKWMQQIPADPEVLARAAVNECCMHADGDSYEYAPDKAAVSHGSDRDVVCLRPEGWRIRKG